MKSTTFSPTALVTGATGFIGSHLVVKLREAGYTVKVYSRHPYRDISGASIDKANWIVGDLDNEEALAAACQEVDVVFHVAGLAHSGHCKLDEILKVNLLGTQKFYNASVVGKVKRFVYFSSILASDPDSSYYAKSKHAAEQFLLSCVSENKQTQLAILRPANVYGPRMRGNIKLFISLAHKRILPALPRLTNTFPLVSVQELCDNAIAIADLGFQIHEPHIYKITDGELYTPNRVEDAVYACQERRRPWLRFPKAAFYLASLAAQLANIIGIKKSKIGLRLYENLVGTREPAKEDALKGPILAPTVTLESEMQKIINELDVA